MDLRQAVYSYLTNGEMAEATDELRLVERVGSHLHATHGVHRLVHPEELIFRDLNLERWWVDAVTAERLIVQLNGERL